MFVNCLLTTPNKPGCEITGNSNCPPAMSVDVIFPYPKLRTETICEFATTGPLNDPRRNLTINCFRVGSHPLTVNLAMFPSSRPVRFSSLKRPLVKSCMLPVSFEVN